MSSDLVVVDISHYQPDPDWETLLNGGVVGVILKCTEGTTYIDETFHRRYGEAQAAGLAVASYHFLRTGNVSAQMEWYLSQCSPEVGERVCLDYEHTDCEIEDLVEAVEILLADPRNLQVACYGASFLSDDVNAASDSQQDVLRKTSLWAARYSSNQPVISTSVWPYWSLWQFTETAKVDGISGNVDGNRFNGSVDACLAWFGPAGSEPAPEPIPPVEPDIVISSMTLAAGTPYEVWVNTSQVAKGTAE